VRKEGVSRNPKKAIAHEESVGFVNRCEHCQVAGPEDWISLGGHLPHATDSVALALTPIHGAVGQIEQPRFVFSVTRKGRKAKSGGQMCPDPFLGEK